MATTLSAFFREPATINYPFEKGPGLEASMHWGGIQTERSGALLASYVKLYAQHR